MNYPYEETGKRIFQLRKSKNLTREQLAEKADISIQFLADIEMGRKSMSATTLRNLSISLGVTTDYIIFDRINNETTSNKEEIVALIEGMSAVELNGALDILKTYINPIAFLKQ